MFSFNHSLFQPLIHEAWVNETIPNEWTDGIIVKIAKKGNLRDCDNSRGIRVLPVVEQQSTPTKLALRLVHYLLTTSTL